MKSNQHTLAYGDRIFARILINGKGVMETVVDRVADMSQLIGTLRHLVRKYRGLAKLYIRNITRGWSMERPLMLYPDGYKDAAGRRHLTNISGAAPEAPHVQLPFNWRH